MFLLTVTWPINILLHIQVITVTGACTTNTAQIPPNMTDSDISTQLQASSINYQASLKSSHKSTTTTETFPKNTDMSHDCIIVQKQTNERSLKPTAIDK